MASLDSGLASDGINFPFYAYPGFPFSGYYDTKMYCSELHRLLNYIRKLTDKLSNKKTIIHISIGAAMEEYYNEADMMKSDQWQQLFPMHLQELIKTDSAYKIYHIIISPNKSFSKEHFIAPAFIKNTMVFGWKMIEDRVFASTEKCNMEVAIFYTPMPCVDNRNSQIVQKLYDSKYIDSGIDPMEYVQTDCDIKFINSFYGELTRMADKLQYLGGILTCFSFAVFHYETTKAKINNYTMFPQICDIFSKNYKLTNRLLAEWYYKPDYYCVHTYEKCCNMVALSYNNNIDLKDSKYIKISDHRIILLDAINNKSNNKVFCGTQDNTIEIDIDGEKKKFSVKPINDVVCKHIYDQVDTKLSFDIVQRYIASYMDTIPVSTMLTYLLDKPSFCDLLDSKKFNSTDLINFYKQLIKASHNEKTMLMKKHHIETDDILSGELEIKALAKVLEINIIIITEEGYKKFNHGSKIIYVLYNRKTRKYHNLSII
jgi:hypothetical protein